MRRLLIVGTASGLLLVTLFFTTVLPPLLNGGTYANWLGVGLIWIFMVLVALGIDALVHTIRKKDSQ